MIAPFFFKRAARLGFLLLLMPAARGSADTLPFDFATPAQFESRFRTVVALGGGMAGQGSAGHLVVNAASAGGNSTAVFLFDATPADSGYATQSVFPHTAPLSVSFLVRAAGKDSSVGVVLADPRNANRNLSAVFAFKDGDDVVRFHRDGRLTATSITSGATVGPMAALAVPEPSAAGPLRVTFGFSFTGPTPVITVRVADLPPVTSAYSAGDIDWAQSLLLLRVGDGNVSVKSGVEIAGLAVTGSASPAPPAMQGPPAPGPDGNLLTVNPGFESGTLNNFSGAYSLPGWTGQNYLFANHALRSGSAADAGVTEGAKRLFMSWGGQIATAPEARASAVAGQTFELRHDQRSSVRKFPQEKLGVIRSIEFFDSAGIRLKQAWGLDSDYAVQRVGVDKWETFALRATAPAGTASVGVRLDAPSGRFVSKEQNFTQDRHVEFDHVRLTLVPETVDRVAWRRLPRLVEPGRTSTLRLHHASSGPRLLRASLLDASGAVRATAQTQVPAGRHRNTALAVPVPAGLPNGTYVWRLQLLPAAGVGAVAATRDLPGVLCDQSVTPPPLKGADFPADHPRIAYMGRIEDGTSGERWLNWYGSEVRVRFSGTSLALLGGLPANAAGGTSPEKLLVIVNENFSEPVTCELKGTRFTQPLVSGLPDGVHTARLFKPSESNVRIRIDGLRVDAGRGLLAPEPPSPRRLEIYGDSVTSGGSASPGFNGYAPLLGRELDAEVHIISKGGTGVAASFSNQDILVNYYRKLNFPNVFKAATAPDWDFARWTPHAVVCAIGHNDQFNNGLATFNARYAEFKAGIRAAYPKAAFITANTLISANHGQLQNAVDPLVAADPLHTFAFTAHRAFMDAHGLGLPADYAPPFNYCIYYECKNEWQRPQAAALIPVAASLGCTLLYTDQGWETGFGSGLWDEPRLGPCADFVAEAARAGLDVGVLVSLHASPAGAPAWTPECFRRTPDGAVEDGDRWHPHGLCAGSPRWREEKTRRLAQVAAAGVKFFSFDFNDAKDYAGFGFRRYPCHAPGHDHAGAQSEWQHVAAVARQQCEFREACPTALVEAHDWALAGDASLPGYLFPASAQERWGFEYMWNPFADLQAGRLQNLVWFNLAYSRPLYLHLDLANDHPEQLTAFWFLASTIRHLGIGNFTTLPPERQASVRAACALYLARREYFTHGVFFASGPLVHVHALPGRGAIVMFFNDTAAPLEVAASFQPADLGLADDAIIQSETWLGPSVEISNHHFTVTLPAWGVAALAVAPA